MISSQFIQSCQSGDENAIKTLVRTYQRAVFQLALSIIDDGQETRPGKDASGSTGGNKSSSDAGGISFSNAAAEAEAATRQTFIAAIDRMGRYREDTNFETWLFRIAIQVSRQRSRRWKARRWLTGLLIRAWRGITHRPGRQISNATPGTAGPEPAAAAKDREPEQTDQAAPQQDPHLHQGDDELWSAVRRLDEKLRVPIVLRYYHDFPISEIAHLLDISEGTVHARLDAAREKISQSNP